MKRRVLLALPALTLPALAACAPGTDNFSTTQSLSVRENLPEGFAPWSDAPAPYRFGAGDRVKVQFLLTPELNEVALVAPDGSIALRAAGRVVGETMTGERQRRLVEEFLHEASAPGSRS